MTLTVEDGTGISNANSYESAANHVSYAALYGVTKSSAQAEIDLRKAMDYIESFGFENGGAGFKGNKQFDSTVNDLMFPRTNLYLNGVLLTATQTITKIKKVLNEAALGVGQGADPLAIKGGKVLSQETFGVISRQYAGNLETPLINPRVDLFLSPLLKNEMSPLHFRVLSDKEAAYVCTHPECTYGCCNYLNDGYSYYE